MILSLNQQPDQSGASEAEKKPREVESRQQSPQLTHKENNLITGKWKIKGKGREALNVEHTFVLAIEQEISPDPEGM